MPEKPFSIQLSEARNTFREKRPLDALAKVRSLAEQHPREPDIVQFQAAVLAHIDAKMRQSLRALKYDDVVYWAMGLVFEPDYAGSSQSAIIEALRQTKSEADRYDFLIDLCQSGPVNISIWQELGTLLGTLPASAYQISIGFRILRNVPGDSAVLEALSQQLSRLGFYDSPNPEEQARLCAILWQRIGSNDPEACPLDRRTEIYNALRGELGVSDPADDGVLDGVKTFLALEHAIAQIEADFRPKDAIRVPELIQVWDYVDCNAAEYVLTRPPELSPQARQLLARTHAPEPGWSFIRRMQVILSLWLRSVSHDASQDRIGYLWLVMDPLIHVLLICALPLIIYADYVADMETFPFAVIGACFWLSCRMAATGSLAGGGILKSQLVHPALRPLDIMIARAISAPVTYFFVGGTLLLIAAYLGLMRFPVNLPQFLLYFVIIWILGLSYGIIVYSLIRRYHGVRRINGFLLRIFALTSGLFYVTEQMPDTLANIVLWNPTVHILQLARSAWFFNYQSSDADPTYAFGVTLVLASLALASLAVDERRVSGVRA